MTSKYAEIVFDDEPTQENAENIEQTNFSNEMNTRKEIWKILETHFNQKGRVFHQI